jgi:energy-coupling factor transporter ATP-binding protein EcfA2
MAQRDSAPSTAILSIECEQLFGTFTYKLKPKGDRSEDDGQSLLLLYGDNGSGKTTISLLLFHMLSRGDGRGHRTFLAKTIFRKFQVNFANGSYLCAERQGNALIGAYILRASDSNGEDEMVEVRTSDDGSVKHGDIDDDQLQAVLDIAASSNLHVYLLSDNRTLQSDVFDDDPSEDWVTRHGRIVTRMVGDSREHIMVPSRTRDLVVAPSIWRVESWLKRQAIRATNTGEVNASNIYNEIIKRITQSADLAPSDSADSLKILMNALSQLAERSTEFSAYGLSQPVAIETLETLVKASSPQQAVLLSTVLEPYVDSIRSKLDAFSTLQRRIKTFLSVINAFYNHKVVRITVDSGIDIYGNDGRDLDPNLLSSGEKQLLLLLCNILVATTESSVFIIDEPELSLNIKWQRQLIDSLLALVESSNVQFVMATHSIELLTRHKSSVATLGHLE